MTRRSSAAMGLAVLVLALGAAACGGDDDESPAAGEAMTETVSTEGTMTETTETDGTTDTDGTTTSEDDGATGDRLDGETGPGFEIEVTQDGEDVQTLEAGTYTLHVEDKSEMHNFHLIGPGVDEVVTEVDFVGERSVTVTLQAGTYTYQCDPHAANMNGTFTVS